jgi:anti-sigma B factor antagonist
MMASRQSEAQGKQRSCFLSFTYSRYNPIEMSITRTELWKNNTFSVERIEGQAPRTMIFHIKGPFNARDMYGSMKQVALGNIFDLKPAPGTLPPLMHIFNLTEVPQMDSSGLGLIVSHFIRCRGKGVRLVVVGASPNVLQLFKFTKVDSLLPLAATLEEALSS